MDTEDWSAPRCTFLVADKVRNTKIDTYCNKLAVGTTLVDKFSGTIAAPRCAEHFPLKDQIPGSTLNDLSGEEL